MDDPCQELAVHDGGILADFDFPSFATVLSTSTTIGYLRGPCVSFVPPCWAL